MADGDRNMSAFSARGEVEGTGSAITVRLGFRPTAVFVYNVDGDARLDWVDTMDADSGFKTVAAGTTAQITSDGITAGSHGFIIGADSDINVSAETINYVAFR